MRYLFSVLFLAYALSGCNFSNGHKECSRPELSKDGSFKLTQLDTSSFSSKGTVEVNGTVKVFDVKLDAEGWKYFTNSAEYKEIKQVNDPGFNDFLSVIEYKICLEEKKALSEDNKKLIVELLNELKPKDSPTSTNKIDTSRAAAAGDKAGRDLTE